MFSFWISGLKSTKINWHFFSMRSLLFWYLWSEWFDVALWMISGRRIFSTQTHNTNASWVEIAERVAPSRFVLHVVNEHYMVLWSQPSWLSVILELISEPGWRSSRRFNWEDNCSCPVNPSDRHNECWEYICDYGYKLSLFIAIATVTLRLVLHSNWNTNYYLHTRHFKLLLLHKTIIHDGQIILIPIYFWNTRTFALWFL